MNHPLRIRFKKKKKILFLVRIGDDVGSIDAKGITSGTRVSIECGRRETLKSKEEELGRHSGAVGGGKKKGAGSAFIQQPVSFLSSLHGKKWKYIQGRPWVVPLFYFFPLPGNWTNGRISSIIPFPSSHSPSIYPCFLSLSLFKCSFTPRGNHFERTSKEEEEEEKLCYFSSFPFFHPTSSSSRFWLRRFASVPFLFQRLRSPMKLWFYFKN